MLPDGRILVSWADGPVNDLSEQSVTPPEFGVYIFDPVTKKNQLIYNDRETWSLNALAVAPRAEPPVIGDLVSKNQDPGTPVRIGSVDVTKTSLTDTVKGGKYGDRALRSRVALKDAVKVRIIEGFSSEGAKGVTMFGLTMDEGAAILGEADVYADGSWLAEIPPFIPVHLQPIDKYGMSIRNQRLWIQGMPGEDRRCVGCHEQRSGIGAPRLGQNPTVAEQAQAQAYLHADRRPHGVPVGAQRREVPGRDGRRTSSRTSSTRSACPATRAARTTRSPARRYTVTSTTPATGASQVHTIPYLDLSTTAVTVVYDRKVETYPASYVSLFFPATMELGMGNAQPVGDVPPKWAIVGNARESQLIKKLNVKAADGTFAYGIAGDAPRGQGRDPHRRGARDTDSFDRRGWAVLLASEHGLRSVHRRPRRPRPEILRSRENAMRSPKNKLGMNLAFLASAVLACASLLSGSEAKGGNATENIGGTQALYGNIPPDQIEFLSTGDRIKSVAASGSMMAIWETLEHGERVECLDCIPSVEPLLYDANPRTREIAAWWLRRRIFGVFGTGEVYERTLQTLASDPDPKRRAYAAYALGEFLAAPGIEACAAAIDQRRRPERARGGGVGARSAQRRRPRRAHEGARRTPTRA